MEKSLTISIVTYNNEKEILNCLYSLKNQSWQNFDVIIVDNNSSDATTKLVQMEYPHIKIIKQSKNTGFGAAHNISIKKTDTPWVMVLNPDTFLLKNALRNLMKHTKNSLVAAIGPKLLRPEKLKPVLDTAGMKKSFFGEVIDRGCGCEDTTSYNIPQYVWGISGSCVIYRKEALEQISYKNKEFFDENFFMYKEDVDLNERLNQKGWLSWYEPKAIGYHDRTSKEGRKGLTETYRRRKEKPDYLKYHSYKNHWYYLVKHTAWYNLPPIVIYEMGKLGYLILYERETLKAIPEMLGNLKIMIKRRYER